MKISNMSNDELAQELEEAAKLYETDDDGEREEYAILRESAARLRRADDVKTAYDRAVSADARHAIENESLLHCLKVAEDALTVVFKNTAYGERFFSTTCEFVHEKAKNALAAIREEGGAR